jgi:hypothetical protein
LEEGGFRQLLAPVIADGLFNATSERWPYYTPTPWHFPHETTGRSLENTETLSESVDCLPLGSELKQRLMDLTGTGATVRGHAIASMQLAPPLKGARGPHFQLSSLASKRLRAQRYSKIMVDAKDPRFKATRSSK